MQRRKLKDPAKGDLLPSPPGRKPTRSSTFPLLAAKAAPVLPAMVAVVDTSGEILLVNDAWLDAACANDVDDLSTVSTGANYLDACRRASNAEADSRRTLEGIEGVLDGSQSSFTAEYRCDSPTQQRWYQMNVSPVQVGKRQFAVIAHQETTAHKMADRERRANEAWLQALFRNSAIGIGELSPEGRWSRSNERLERLTGLSSRQLSRATYLELVPAEDADSVNIHLELALSGAIDSFVLEHRLLRSDGSLLWVNASLSGVRGQRDAVDCLIAVFEDMSERKAAEARQHTLMLELAHRSKNLLSVVQSIASRSLIAGRPAAEASQAFEGRLQALSNSFGTLTDESFGGTLLESVLRGELEPFGTHARLDGPSIALTVKATQTMALVIHELATNAAKYGALSSPQGRIAITWDIVGDPDDRRFVFEWQESGGPRAVPPSRTGFGTTLLQQIVVDEMNGCPELHYELTGFFYRLDAPLALVGAAQLDSPIRRRMRNPVVRELFDVWQRHARMHGALPPLTAFDLNRFAATGMLTMATIDDQGKPYFVQIGRGLRAKMPVSSTNDDLAVASGVSIAQAYRRCVDLAEPTHEYMRFDFGDGAPVTFERLLIPFSINPERGVTHVIGMVVFDEAVAASARARESLDK